VNIYRSGSVFYGYALLHVSVPGRIVCLATVYGIRPAAFRIDTPDTQPFLAAVWIQWHITESSGKNKPLPDFLQYLNSCGCAAE